MSPEQIKMVFDAIATVSGDASAAAKAWIILHYIQAPLIWAIIAGTVIKIVSMIVRACVQSDNNSSGYRQFANSVRIAVGYKNSLEYESAQNELLHIIRQRFGA